MHCTKCNKIYRNGQKWKIKERLIAKPDYKTIYAICDKCQKK